MHPAFNTCQIDQRLRLAYWTEVICETFLTVDCRQQDRGPISGELLGCRVGPLDLIDVTSPPMEYYRGPSQLRGHSEEHFQLVLQINGNGHLQQHGRQALLSPGDVALYSACTPSSIAYPAGSRTLAVKIPRAQLLERISCDERVLSLSLAGSSAMGAMVGGLIRQCYSFGSDPLSASDSRLTSGMLDIIGYAFDGGQMAPRRNPLEQVKRYMRQHLGDPDLALCEVASRHHLSMRTLNRLFAAEGSTPSRWLWQQRLEASHRSLSEGRVRQVSEAALNCGFNDLSHFSKAFKKTFGVSPNQVLRSTR